MGSWWIAEHPNVLLIGDEESARIVLPFVDKSKEAQQELAMRIVLLLNAAEEALEE